MLRRTTTTLSMAALAMAVLLGGCSSSPDFGKLSTRADTPAPVTAPPADEPASGADADTAPPVPPGAPQSGKAPSPWGDGLTVPPSDALADVDTSDASAEQAAEIEDRDVTLDEYHAAFDRFAQCLSTAGFELLGPQFYDGSYHYSMPNEAVTDGTEDECYRAEFAYVDMLWQASDRAANASD